MINLIISQPSSWNYIKYDRSFQSQKLPQIEMVSSYFELCFTTLWGLNRTTKLISVSLSSRPFLVKCSKAETNHINGKSHKCKFNNRKISVESGKIQSFPFLTAKRLNSRVSLFARIGTNMINKMILVFRWNAIFVFTKAIEIDCFEYFGSVLWSLKALKLIWREYWIFVLIVNLSYWLC